MTNVLDSIRRYLFYNSCCCCQLPYSLHLLFFFYLHWHFYYHKIHTEINTIQMLLQYCQKEKQQHIVNVGNMSSQVSRFLKSRQTRVAQIIKHNLKKKVINIRIFPHHFKKKGDIYIFTQHTHTKLSIFHHNKKSTESNSIIIK